MPWSHKSTKEALWRRKKHSKSEWPTIQKGGSISFGKAGRTVRANIANRYRDALIKWYGEERGKAVKYAEAFEICEYADRPSEDRIKELFPFFGE